MYCSSYGMGVAQGLSYCKHCGAKLSGAKGDDGTKSEVNPALLASAMVGLFIFGILSIGILIRVMNEVAGFTPPVLLAFTIFSFVLLLLVEGVLIRLLLKGKRGSKEADDTERLKEQTTKELGEAQARALPEPIPSVTEHTTRSFEPIYSERESK